VRRYRRGISVATVTVTIAVGWWLFWTWRVPIDGDQGWLLWLARMTVRGEAVYRDWWDTNPPLSHWMLLPAGAAIETFNSSVRTVFNFYVLLWCAAAMLVASRIWRQWTEAPLSQGAALAAATVILLLLPGPFVGQREHFMLAAALPWIVMLAVWRSGRDVRRPLEGLAAFGIALAIATKPFYVGWWLLGPVLAPRVARRPAFWLVPLLGIAYLAVVATTPYPGYLSEWAGLYVRYARRPWWFAAFGNPFALLAIGSVVITWRTALKTPLGTALWAATLVAWIGAVSQQKALMYHYYCADALALLLLVWANGLTRRNIAFPVGLAWGGYLVWFALVRSEAQLGAAAALARATGQESVMVLTPTADHAWLLNTEFGRPWLSTHYDLWWLAVSRGRDTVPGLDHWREQDALLRRSLLTPRLPSVLLIARTEVDVLTYLLKSPEWRAALASYRQTATVAGYEVWRRAARD
jgi:hypothetical protein